MDLFFTDCPVQFVGEIVDLGPQDVPDNRSGLYVLPQSIQFPGRVMSIEAVGVLTEEITHSNQMFFSTTNWVMVHLNCTIVKQLHTAEQLMKHFLLPGQI